LTTALPKSNHPLLVTHPAILALPNISSKFVNNFLDYSADRLTNKGKTSPPWWR